MKMALLSDTHWGVRNDSDSFINASKKFLDDIFFPYLDQNDINTIVHLGDLVDRRKFININTASRLQQDFIRPIIKRKIDFHMIAGNHDTYFKNTNDVNSLELTLSLMPSAKIYTKATEVTFDGTKILFIPWICDDNKKHTFKKIKDTNAQICFGHLELSGFQMFKGSMPSHGDDPVLFSKFDLVCSGHFHHRSVNGNIHYLGNHIEFTWSDYDDPKGFHIFDTETRELKFISNPEKIFTKVWYDDSLGKLPPIPEVANKILKVVVKNKTNHYFFDQYIESIEKQNPIEVQIVEDNLSLVSDDQDIVNEAESTVDIFKKYIGYIDYNNKKKLEDKIIDLYNEALSIE